MTDKMIKMIQTFLTIAVIFKTNVDPSSEYFNIFSIECAQINNKTNQILLTKEKQQKLRRRKHVHLTKNFGLTFVQRIDFWSVSGANHNLLVSFLSYSESGSLPSV